MSGEEDRRESAAVQKDFNDAARSIARAADVIAREVTTLLQKTSKYERVSPDYVIETLIVRLFRGHPAAVAWLDRQNGKGSMRLAEALKDYLDLWQSR